MLEDSPASSATPPRSSISPANSSKIPESRPKFGETSCAFGRLEGVRKRIYEVYLEAIVSSSKWNPRALFECPDLGVSSSVKTRAEHEIDEGHSDGHGLDGGDEWVVTELRRVRENIRPFQVACRVREREREKERRVSKAYLRSLDMMSRNMSSLSRHLYVQ